MEIVIWNISPRRRFSVATETQNANGGLGDCQFLMKRQVHAYSVMESPSSHCGTPWKLMLIAGAAVAPTHCQLSELAPHHQGALHKLWSSLGTDTQRRGRDAHANTGA